MAAYDPRYAHPGLGQDNDQKMLLYVLMSSIRTTASLKNDGKDWLPMATELQSLIKYVTLYSIVTELQLSYYEVIMTSQRYKCKRYFKQS